MNGIRLLLDHAEARALGWALLHFVWQGTLVGGLAGLVIHAVTEAARAA